jgi:hypothetical protein
MAAALFILVVAQILLAISVRYHKFAAFLMLGG